MKKLFVVFLICIGCNNSDSNKSGNSDSLQNDQNSNTDTRTVDPKDTTHQLDTGSYKQMSDSLRKQ